MTEPKRTGLASSFAHFIKELGTTLRGTLNISDNAQPEQTIEGIQRDVTFKGFNIWILILAIFICSIGLNVNSTAVVIGAMLISPLMGPIIGVGLSVGIYDWNWLQKSLKNLGIAVGFAVATSTIYFLITPLSDAQSELLARTRPHLLDVFIAFFGGMAGILAGSRKEKTNVVPGVAIATALMPPLCTAGYGLATQQWNFFFGAFYLFLINSVFISLATLLVVRYLRFPIKQFMDEKRKSTAKRYIALFTVLIMLPAAWVFYQVVTESLFNRKIDTFMNEVVQFEGTEVVKKTVDLTDSTSILRVVLFGEPVPEEVVSEWKRQLPKYGLTATTLKIFQGQDGLDATQGKMNTMVDLFSSSQEQLRAKDQIISGLQLQLLRYQKEEMPLQQLTKELVAQDPDLEGLTFFERIQLDATGAALDTIPTFQPVWKEGMGKTDRENRQKRLADFLRIRLNDERVEVL